MTSSASTSKVAAREGHASLPSESYVPQTMPRVVTTRGMIAFFVMTVFWSSNVTGVATGGTAGLTYWLIIALLFFAPCCVVVAQLGKLYPHEGSIYNWTYRALGEFASFFVGICAWLPGTLSLVSAAVVVVSCLQTFNNQWLTEVWQQGLVILVVVILAGIIAMQRTRVMQSITVFGAVVTMLFIAFMGLAGIFWLLKGHPSMTNFGDRTGWLLNLDFNTGNIYLLGTVTLALLGATMPLSMGGELEDRRSVGRHLLIGGAITIAGYLIVTFVLLVVQGAGAAQMAPNPIALLIATADAAFGKLGGNLAAVGVMCFFVIVAAVENVVSARLLMVAAIDRRIPTWLGRLSKVRVPANAIMLQTIFAVIYIVAAFFLVPLIDTFGSPAVINTKVYNVTAACLLVVWAISFLFPFIDVAVLYARDRAAFIQNLVVPVPVLFFCIIIGPLVCLATIGVTLYYSFVPSLIPNGLSWFIVVGGITLLIMIISAAASLVASSEAIWERWVE